MIYHLIVGDAAAEPLKQAVAMEPSIHGEVIVLKDILHVGPIQKEKEEGASFSALRSAFWQQILLNEKNPAQVDDMERLLEVSNKLFKDDEDQVWFWMAPWPADISAYYWTLKYLSKHQGRFYLINIAGLPFLDENGKVYYPKNISNILPRELVKARRLARLVTPAEIEVDSDEWNKMVQENAAIRTHEGGKKLISHNDDYYDNQLISFCSHQFQKASRIISQAMSKYNIPTGDIYLGWRLRKMAENGTLQLSGDITKTLRDFEVKLPGEASNDTVGIP
ncbi:MAG TPA: DUF3658 domain-containing protein [Flavipsychrobacter sp.]|nr:DUF3658 domain-containing protein [Flavipsychrobacter sp.]